MYRFFKALNLFQEGNEQAADLYLEWASQIHQNPVKNVLVQNKDTVFLMDECEFRLRNNMMQVLILWIANAKSREDFDHRIRINDEIFRAEGSVFLLELPGNDRAWINCKLPRPHTLL